MAEPQYPFTMWRWRIYDSVTQRRITTRYHMTESDALAKDPTAEKAPGTEMVIERPLETRNWSPR